MKVSSHYRRKPHACLSSGFDKEFAEAISRNHAASVECERLLTAEFEKSPFMMHKLALALKRNGKSEGRGHYPVPAPSSQTVVDETELLNMIAAEIRRMPTTVDELSE